MDDKLALTGARSPLAICWRTRGFRRLLVLTGQRKKTQILQIQGAIRPASNGKLRLAQGAKEMVDSPFQADMLKVVGLVSLGVGFTGGWFHCGLVTQPPKFEVLEQREPTATGFPAGFGL
jgi:hypothetical protein